MRIADEPCGLPMSKLPRDLTASRPIDLGAEPDFSLGGLLVRPSLREVQSRDRRETVEPRVLQALVALVRAEGSVVSRDRLIEQCWGGRLVGDDAINSCIAKVRGLAALAGPPAFEIETIPRVGYRLHGRSDHIAAPETHSVAGRPRVPAAEVSQSPAVSEDDPAATQRWRKFLVTASATALALALVTVLFIVVVPRSHNPLPAPSRPTVSQQISQPAGEITIAVLPFANLSGDPGQDFFSDGVTEEINGALAHVTGLRVIARSSAFQFKNQNRDARAVARLIGATHVIEGSIRKDGARVRISVQLVRGSDGVSLWSENYDRSMTDIFALQEAIASSIAQALRVPLGLQGKGQLVADRTSDIDSYEQYLRARALYRGRRIQEAITVLEPAVARDPKYAPARSLLAMTYGLVPVYLMDEYHFASIAAGRKAIHSAVDKSIAEARMALKLDPQQSEAYVALALADADYLNWAGAEDNFRHALSLNPDEADAMHLYGLMLADTGRAKEALASRQKLHELEPFVPIYNIMTAAFLQLNGRNEESIDLLGSTPGAGPTTYFRNIYLARAYAASGKYTQAADALLAMSPAVKRVSRPSVETAAQLLRNLASGKPLPVKLPLLEGELGFVYAYSHEPGRVLDAVERDVAMGFGDLAPLDSPWLPAYSPVRKTDRFIAFVRNAGLPEYWRKRRWADRCHPRGSEAFACN